MTISTLDEMRAEFAQLETRARRIYESADGHDLEGPAATEFDETTNRMDELRDQIHTVENRIEHLRRFAQEHPENIETSEPTTNPHDHRPMSLRDNAERVLESHVKTKTLDEKAAARAEKLMKTGGTQSQSWAQRWVAATGNEHYESAFLKVLADSTHAHLMWTPQEAQAFRAVGELQAEQRAMGELSGSTGGFMVPIALEPSILLSSDGSADPLRKIARVVQTTGSQWAGITSEGVVAEWVPEATEVSDTSPVLAHPNIPVHKADAFVPFSFELGDDAPNFLQELQTLLVDSADQLNAEAYTTGSGTGQPRGLITALAATPGSIVAPTTPGTLTSADIFNLQNALGPRWQPRAQWTANLETINTVKQFETDNGSLKFPEVATGTLLSRQLNENSNQDSANYSVVYGDFANCFVIVDRIGSTMEVVPHLMGANRRPTLQRGGLLWWRTGSDCVIGAGFRVLGTTTTVRKKGASVG